MRWQASTIIINYTQPNENYVKVSPTHTLEIERLPHCMAGGSVVISQFLALKT